jgi:hypothetical protein
MAGLAGVKKLSSSASAKQICAFRIQDLSSAAYTQASAKESHVRATVGF